MPRPALNKQALNSLTELYYVFVRLIEHMEHNTESKEELDIFYLRGIGNSGGLRAAIIAAYEASNLNLEEAGTPDEPMTLERLLPYKTVSSYTNREKLEQVQDVRADLKYYNDSTRAHEAGMDDASIVLKEKAEEILRKRQLRESSGTESTRVDLRTVHIAHERHTLIVGHVRIGLEPNSNMDLATSYMLNEVRKGETADSRTVAAWVTNHPDYMRASVDSHGIKHALNDVNTLLSERTGTSEILFNTRPRNGIIRNF